MMSEAVDTLPPKRRCVLVCQYRSCVRSGSEAVLEAFRSQTPRGIFVSASQCLGQCGSGPNVQVMPDNTWYCQVQPSDVATIVKEHLLQDRPVRSRLHPRFHPHPEAYLPPETPL